LQSGGYLIRCYRPRIEGLFARLERWTNQADRTDVFWRSISKDNVITFYGKSSDSRIADPSDESKIFSWLVCESYDDKGNTIQYKYKPENGDLVEPLPANERNRSRLAQRYLKHIKYGNQTPHQPNEVLDQRTDWLFEIVFDYGDHDQDDPKPNDPGRWLCRNDPFSSYRARFEVRTYRLCQRVLMFHHFPLEDIGSNRLVTSTNFVYRDSRGNPDDKQKGNPIGSFIAAVTHTGYKRNNGGYDHKSTPPLLFEYSEAKIQQQVREVDADSLANLPIGLDGTGYRWVDLDGEGIPGILSEQADAWFYKRNVSPISTVEENDVTRNVATFEPVEVVAEKPAFASMGAGGWQIQDLAGDGRPDLARFEGAVTGFFERNEEDRWDNFVPFHALPNVNWRDRNLRFVDLTGDGLADILITDDQAFTWYQSLGETGFAPSERTLQAFDEERGPRLVFADGEQSIYLADFSGDGLTDLVRIRNGEVCYWPNLGYGLFGAKVTMDDAPWLDAPDQFSPDRIRLADIDGSGVIDIFYLAGHGIKAYFNQSGNSWSAEQRINQIPPVDNLTAVQVVDLFGNGTACLVWSSPLPGDARCSMRYIDLMGGQKPHLLINTANNLGAKTQIDYTSSTKFYLQDRAAGTPWITKLPFPVHVVERVTVTDKWRRTTFSTTYSYHHGYFDGREREFRGFGRVEQVDTEDYGTFAEGNKASPYITEDETLYQPPVKTITWFHTGVAIDRERILTQFQGEYFPNSLAALPSPVTIDNVFEEKPLPEPDLESLNLTADEWREGLRACKGMTLRQEVYELNVDALQPGDDKTPRQIPVRLFTAATHNCGIRCLQPRGDNHYAVFLVMESEALSYHYELDLRPPVLPVGSTIIPPLEPDPRVAHTLNLLFDDHGNIQQSVAVGYPRWRQSDDSDLAAYAGLIREVQREQHLAYIETHYTKDVIGPDDPLHPAPIQYYRLRVPYEVQTYELTGFTAAHGIYFELSDLRAYHLSDTLPDQGPTLVAQKLYHEVPQDMVATKRLVEDARTLFFDDDETGPDAATRFLQKPLPLGTLGKLGLLYEQYKLALTKTLLDAVFTGGQLEQSMPTVGSVRGALNNWRISGYLSDADATDKFGIPATDEYWMRSGVAGFASDATQHFYLPEKYTDAFDNPTTLEYDGKYDLFIQSSTDALGNTTGVTRFDYRVLAPAELEDLNANQTQAYFDLLGRVIAVAVKGKGTEADSLDGYDDALANPALSQVLSHFDVPPLTVDAVRDLFSPMLGNATTRFLYHFGEKIENGSVVWEDRPAGACTIVREQHVAKVAALRLTDPNAQSPLQVAFECSDGMGTVLMKRSQAEPANDGGTLRWIVAGKTVVNNKGKPVKQYEPYFTAHTSCCAEGDVHEEVGVTPLMYYDAAGRLVRTELPDGTLSRVEFSPWYFKTYDANDTVLESRWYADRGSPGTVLTEPTDPDQRAAWLAAVHSNTPAQTHLDSMGREVIAIVHNRVEDTSQTLTISGRHWRDEQYLTFTRLDAEGKPLWIRDARGNLVMQYLAPPKPDRDEPRVARDFGPMGNPNKDIGPGRVPAYDIAGNLLFQHSMDTGDRWMLNDAAGKPMFAWDSRDNFFVSSYDELHRPTNLELRNPDHADPILAALTQYGEGTSAPKVNNLCGKPYRSFDQSGVVTNQAFDFKGNMLSVVRRLAGDYDPDTDWRPVLALPITQEPDALLMLESFTKITSYDALNRMTLQYNWHRGGKPVAVYQPNYNARGLLAGEALTVGATKKPGDYTGGVETAAIKSVAYDAKGQRLSATLGNGVVTTYTYDPKTFRLLTLVSTRPRAGDLRTIQNLRHTYDPSGNITESFDAAVPTEFFDNAAITSRKAYAYDALYRLTEASGREHAGQLSFVPSDNWNDCPFRVDYGANNSKAWRKYTQRYSYDAVGNILVLQHDTTDTATSWTRQYQYATDSNRLLATGMGSATVDHYPVGGATLEYRYTYNTHGSMEALPHLPTMDWDFAEMLCHISRAPASQGTDPDGCPDTSLAAWYRYDASKQRTRKRVTKQGGVVEERLYLGGLEWYRRMRNGALVEEIETLHLFDGQQRLLMVDQVIKTDRADLGERNLYRYTLSNYLGSSTVELDETADIISYEEYHPYGTTAYQSGRNAAEVKLKRYRYTGMERDEESGLSYHSARYYAPWLGRWGSCDPTGGKDGWNIFQYARSNPITRSDHTGLQTERETNDVIDKLSEIQKPGLVKQWWDSDVYPNRSQWGSPLTEQETAYISEFGGKFTLPDGLTNDQKGEAEALFGLHEDPYAAYSNYVDRRNIVSHYWISHPATVGYLTESYRLLRDANPIHFVFERGFQMGSGTEAGTRKPVSKFTAGVEFIAYFAFAKFLDKIRPVPELQPPALLSWDLPPKGGGRIGGIVYTEHALERMAGKNFTTLAQLERRVIERIEAMGVKPGTKEFGLLWQKLHPDPRSIPPSVVEAELVRPGSTGLTVVSRGGGALPKKVITVIPPKKVTTVKPPE
jgi:RHS repeat-associated protein